MRNLKVAFYLTRNPNASQWNIGCVGSSGVGAGIGHVHFRLFVSISFAFGSQRKRSFQWNMGLSLTSGQLITKLFPDCLKVMLFTCVLCGDRIYEMRCLFVAVGINALFIVLPHWDNTQSHYTDTRPTSLMFRGSYFMLSAMQATTTTILKVFSIAQLPLLVAFYNQQGILRVYSF